MHTGQVITMFLIHPVRKAVWEVTLNLSNGFNAHLKNQDIKFKWWLISNSLRLIEGLVAISVTFMLVIRSDNVVDLFKDFTAILFVSSFDNIVYTLVDMNVIGSRLKKTVTKCEIITFVVNPYH